MPKTDESDPQRAQARPEHVTMTFDPQTRATALAEQTAIDCTGLYTNDMASVIEAALLTFADEIRQERDSALAEAQEVANKLQAVGCLCVKVKGDCEAEKARADALTAERDRLRAALLLVRSTCRSTRDNCWCDDSRDIRACCVVQINDRRYEIRISFGTAGTPATTETR